MNQDPSKGHTLFSLSCFFNFLESISVSLLFYPFHGLDSFEKSTLLCKNTMIEYFTKTTTCQNGYSAEAYVEELIFNEVN